MELLSLRQANDKGRPDASSHEGETTELFNLIFPLPYRVAFLLTLGAWLWSYNLQVLRSRDIDVPSLLRYHRRGSNPSSNPPHHVTTSRFAMLLTAPLACSLLLFWILTRFDERRVLAWEHLGNVTLIAVLVALLVPSLQVPGMPKCAPSGRARFSKSLRRVAVGSIAQTDEGKFGDIILADALTSYSKVIGDLFVVGCMMLRWPHPTAKPIRDCGGDATVPLLMALPFMIRFSQCIIEFRRVRRGEYGPAHEHGWGRAHVLNALKYATAFPVFFFSTRMAPHEYREGGLGYNLWRLAAVVNSLYSFYWDVAKDWDLELLSTKRSRRDSPDYPYGLRRERYLEPASVYYVAVAVDLLLRLTWSVKLSPHMLDYVDMEGTIFWLEVLEILRRWMWIFLRVETEWAREERKRRSLDVLLGGVGGPAGGGERYEDE